MRNLFENYIAYIIYIIWLPFIKYWFKNKKLLLINYKNYKLLSLLFTHMQRVYTAWHTDTGCTYMYTSCLHHFILFDCLLINDYLKIIKILVINYKNYKLFSMLFAVQSLYSWCSNMYDNSKLHGPRRAHVRRIRELKRVYKMFH